jgi:hypothetical protein
LFNALDIYRNEFQPSTVLDKPYIMAGVSHHCRYGRTSRKDVYLPPTDVHRPDDR